MLLALHLFNCSVNGNALFLLNVRVICLAKIAVPLEFPSVLVCFGFLQRQFIVGREKQKSTF